MCQSNQNLNLPPPPLLATHGYFTVVCAGGGREFLSVPGGGGAGNLNLAQVGHFNQKCQDFPV